MKTNTCFIALMFLGAQLLSAQTNQQKINAAIKTSQQAVLTNTSTL
ncbi:hypothetical protein [Mucilaginibacter ginsenosidivorax]|nr:hypothetical protein [Mucilaginibacter ginsenosidivorax]